MNTIKGTDALQRAGAVSKAGGDFCICFLPYSRTKPTSADKVEMKTYEHCTMRRPLPHEKWDVDGKNYFLFSTQDDKPKLCYRSLIRYIGFSTDNYVLYKLKWYE